MDHTGEDLAEFKAEALELLEIGEKSLLDVRPGCDFRVIFDTIARVLHNVKGSAGMMGFPELEQHLHQLETIFIRFKTADTIPAPHLNMFLKGIDGARTLLSGATLVFNYEVEASAAPVAPVPTSSMSDAALNEFWAESEEIIERVSAALAQIEANTHTKPVIDALYRDIHSFKGGAYLFSFNLLGDIAHAMESSMEGIRNGAHLPSKDFVSALFRCLKVLEAGLESAKGKKEMPELAQEARTLAAAMSEATQKLAPAKASASNVPVSAAAAPQPTEKEVESGGTIRVAVSLLDNLMALIGEMVLVRNQVLQFSNHSEDLEFVNLSKRLNVVTSEIQDEMMKTRMQPIGNILTKFTRVVRDLSHELGKEISLQISGQETELDKSLLEAIKDPLTHIIRNSCDHGIEKPEERRRLGKPDVGQIHVRAYHEGGQILVEVSDDGKGLHTDVLIKKAIEKGLIQSSQAERVTEKEAFDFIFAPGFSTAAAVTNVSGRGVGMDVVRTNIERIGGSVDLASVAGRGTTLKIKIPLTLAIVPALIIRSRKGTFAVPQINLVELLRVESGAEHSIEYLQGVPVYRLRGEVLPLVDLGGILSHEGEGEAAESDSPNSFNIVVVKADQRSFGLIVEEIHDTADIVVKPLNRLLKSLQVYSGATIMGDGSVALILDVLGISKVAQLGLGRKAIEAAETVPVHAEAQRGEMQDYLLFKTHSPTKHAIVLNSVHRLEEFPVSKVEWAGTQRVVRYRQVILPLVSVNEQLGYPATERTGTIPVVVIRRAGNFYGLEVDEIIDTLSSDVEVDSTLARKAGVFGNLNTESELIVVVNPFDLISGGVPAANAPESNLLRNVSGLGPIQVLKSILVVEDTPFFRRVISGILEKAGYKVTTAIDGRQAVDLLERDKTPVQLVVSDIDMPRMNGFELARALRKNEKFEKVPLLALSARADQTYVREASEAGFSVYLEKLKPQALLGAVAELLEEKKVAA